MSLQKKMGGMVSEGGDIWMRWGVCVCSEGWSRGCEDCWKIVRDCWKNLPQTHICWKVDLLVARQPLSRFLVNVDEQLTLQRLRSTAGGETQL